MSISFIFTIFEEYVFFEVTYHEIVLLLYSIYQKSIKGYWNFLFTHCWLEDTLLLLWNFLVLLFHTESAYLSDGFILTHELSVSERVFFMFFDGICFLCFSSHGEIMSVVVSKLLRSTRNGCILHIYFCCFDFRLLYLF